MLRPPTLVALALAASAALVPGLGTTAAAAPSVVPAVAAVVDPDPANRESMRRGYLEILKPAMEVPIGWTGDVAACDAGAPSAAAQDATLTAVNYFRDLVGVEPVVFDAALSAHAQEAALIMAANADLSHHPEPSWTCYSGSGYTGASHSNLYLGVTGAASVAGYMVDPGAGNEAAGHRRWIIDPGQTTMGSGSVEDPDGAWSDVANALYVIDQPSWQATPATTPDFMPWPVAGYMPLQLEPYGRWSLSAKGNVDFSAATVTVNGSAAGITVHPVQDGYGPNTLVWNFDPGFDPGDADRTYHVAVAGISGGASSTYAYDVTLFDADPPQPEAQSIAFDALPDRTYGAQPSTLEAEASSGLPVTFASTTPAVCSTSGARGRTLSLVGVGTCTVAANQAGDDTYAPAPEQQRSFTVAKKQLTVTALDAARRGGEPNPDFEVAWSGFAYGQTLATSGVTGAPSCSSPATTDSPDGDYPITCSVGTLASANYSFGFQAGTLRVDGTPPEVSRAGDAFEVALGAFDAAWVVDDESGVDGVQQRETTRSPTTSYAPWSTPDGWGSGTTEWAGQPPGETICVSARGRDRAGNVSGWSPATCIHTPQDSASLDAPRRWRTVEGDGYWKGSALQGRRQGAALKIPGAVEVDRVGIVASRCRGCGKVGIYVGKQKVGSFSLNGKRTKHRLVMLLPRLDAPRDGAVKVVVESRGRKVRIDGVIVSGPPAG